MLEAQNGVCAICGKPESRRSKKTGHIYALHVDHDHKTGDIRGLLCHHCNAGLGHFADNVEAMEKAIAYLKQSRV